MSRLKKTLLGYRTRRSCVLYLREFVLEGAPVSGNVLEIEDVSELCFVLGPR